MQFCAEGVRVYSIQTTYIRHLQQPKLQHLSVDVIQLAGANLQRKLALVTMRFRF